jgi:hypothetical protein
MDTVTGLTLVGLGIWWLVKYVRNERDYQRWAKRRDREDHGPGSDL